VPAVATERAPRLWAGDPVDADARAALENAHAAPRRRPHDAVDGASVEAASVKADLEASDVGCSAGAGLRGEREQPDEREQRNACSESHERLSFALKRDYPRPR
jgi:hypothetical protein